MVILRSQRCQAFSRQPGPISIGHTPSGEFLWSVDFAKSAKCVGGFFTQSIVLYIELYGTMYRTMPKVSKRALKEKTLNKIHKRLVNTLRKASLSGRIDSVLEDLLTESEEIMLAKRLSIIFLLNEGASSYFIHKHLSVSKNTVSYMKENLLKKEYDSILRLFCNKKEREEMWRYLEIVLRGGMPEYGKGRWKGFLK